MSGFKMYMVAAVMIMASAAVSAHEDYDGFHEKYTELMRHEDFDGALECAKQFCEESSGTENELLALSYVGQSAMAVDEYDTARVYLQKAMKLWSETDSLDRTADDYAGIITVYNAMGIYSINLDMDYRKAVEYFLAGLRYAQVCANHYMYAILGLNLAVMCDLRDDTSGLRYAREIYLYGQKSGDTYILGSGAYACAMMYLLCGEPDLAEKYLEEALQNSVSGQVPSNIYCLEARLSEERGDGPDVTEEYYDKAMETAQSVTDRLHVRLYYGKYLTAAGRYGEALNVLGSGLRLADARNMRIYKYRFYGLMSGAYEGGGDYVRALDYYKRFQKEYNDVYSIEKERAISELSRKYEKEQHELEMMKKSRELRTVLLFAMIVVVTLVAVYILYRHKNRMYVSIVRQHTDALKKERKLEDYIVELESRLDGNSGEGEKYAKSSLEDRKKNELFASLEKTMKEGRAYREAGLTGDRLAKMAGTNRTYLSRVVNEMTGMTLLAYINSYRIDEAIAVLSDAGNDIPLKALSADLGFKSITTFYKFFAEKVGMTPAKYREKIIYLSRKSM